MRSIHSRHYIYTHWLRIDMNNDEIKQWEQLKNYWNKYDCSMTVYYYDYNPLTVKSSIKEYCKKNLASYAIPKEFEFRKSLPKTLIGKVDFKKLREEAVKDEEE